MSDSGNLKSSKFLTFNLADQLYGVPIECVREINGVLEVTPVPHTPTFVAGVVNLRGKVIPVINLRLKLGFHKAELTRESCIVVTEVETGQVGIIVDSVSSVVDFKADEVEPAPRFGAEQGESYVLGLARQDGRVTILLNIAEALSRENFKSHLTVKAPSMDRVA